MALRRGSTYICQRRSALPDRRDISRGLIDLKGAVPDRTRGFGHTAPTYFVGTRDRILHRLSWIATSSPRNRLRSERREAIRRRDDRLGHAGFARVVACLFDHD